MYNLDKKQKMILGMLATIVIGAICYYVYAKDDNIVDETQNENLEIEETTKEDIQDTEEKYSDTIIIVHITGAVNNEGIVELKLNSRIADAIDKAGGLREDANTDKINLAYILEDGMKVYIPSVNDKEDIGNNNDNTEEYVKRDNQINTSNNYNNATNSSNKDKTNTTKININTATQTNLEELPGIGPSTALKIIQYRDENGKFKSIEDIKKVSGIGESKYNNIKDLITTK